MPVPRFRMQHARALFDQLNHDLLQLLRTEGELYWSTHTGQSDDHQALSAATFARKMFVGDAQRLAQVKAHIAEVSPLSSTPERDTLLRGLNGWVAMFEANATGSELAKEMLAALLDIDADFFHRRQTYKMTHIDANGQRTEATPAAVRANLVSNPDESARLSSSEALYGLERWIVENGFVDIVGKRNALARELGYRNFFEYRLKQNTGVTPAQLFSVFDEFERSTRAAHRDALSRLEQRFGDDALLPHNLAYCMRGQTTIETDAYFPFSKALERWAESYRRMGVSFGGSKIQIDLLDREGKFPTGFCIAPTPGYIDDTLGNVPADVRFTSTARPFQPGAGLRGLNVLFHEAGHAAHYSNVTMNSPCFSQEFPPSSPALLETQAKFFDALPSDPAWMKRYAKDIDGNPMPDDMIRAHSDARQDALVILERRDLIPTYFESALYAMSDDERTPDAILALARSVTQRILGIPGHTDYVLAIPHPILHDIAVYYHGYLLAKMAAAQVRAHLLASLGHIVDNSEVGRLLATHCWAPGNAATLDQTLTALTGKPLNPAYLSAECNRSADDAWAAALQAMQRIEDAELTSGSGDLNASISIVHGSEHIASNETSLSRMYAEFESWLENYRTLNS